MSGPSTLTPAPEPTSEPVETPARSAQERADRARMRTLVAVITGLAVGAALWFGATHLAGEFEPLIDSPALFLLAPWVLGALMRTRSGAAAAGLGCALLTLGTWAALAGLRSDPFSAHLALALLACALIGGPLLGAAGQLARRGGPRRRPLGVGAAASVAIAVGAWGDLHELHAVTIGWLSVAVGGALCLTLLAHPRRLAWLALTLPLALLGDVLLTRIGH